MHEAILVRYPARDVVTVYVGGDGYALSATGPGPTDREVVRRAPHEERAIFAEWTRDEYEAIETAILLHASRALAERETLAADVADARSTRDRLLSLVERFHGSVTETRS